MARSFVVGNTEYLRVTNSPVTAEPVTLACWAKLNSVAATHRTAMSIGEVAAGDYHALQVTNTIVWRARSWDGAAQEAIYTAAVALESWHHLVAVFAADNDRRIYVDGDRGTDDANAVVVGAFGAVSIGVSADSTPYGYMDGEVAEAAVWDVALTDNEIFQLAQGTPVVFVRPQSLGAYYSLFETDRDFWRSIYNMTAINAPGWAPHPPKVLEFWRRIQSR